MIPTNNSGFTMKNSYRETDARIYLSPLEDDHIIRYMSLSDDPELVKTMGWSPFDTNDRKRFIEFTKVLSVPSLVTAKSAVFSVVIKSDNTPIGFVSLKGIDENSSFAEVGIAIMDRRYRGCGYGTEALRLLVSYAFETVGLNSIGLTVFPSNQGAIRAYKKLGFHKIRLLKESWLKPNNEYVDMWLMTLKNSCSG